MSAGDPFPSVTLASEEVYRSAAYHYENVAREGPQLMVVQRTLSGAAYFQDESGTRQIVPPGFAMLFTHQEPTAYGYPPEATEPYRQRFISFSSTAAHALFERLRIDFGSVVRMPEKCEATTLFDEIILRFRKHQFRDRLHQAELLYRLLIALYREQVQETRTSDPVEFGHHYVRSHFRSPVNLKGVADLCGISREHFIRQFSARYGEPPGNLLRRLRLEYAQTLVTTTVHSIEDIALASGFTSSNTFCRAYRLRFKESPGRARG